MCIANGSCGFIFFLGKILCVRESVGLIIMLNFFSHIDLCKYATNPPNTVNCIPVGQVLLMQTQDPSVEGMASQAREIGLP